MEDIIKICAFALLSVVICIVVRQICAEYAVFVQICSIAAIAVFILNYVTDLFAEAASLIELSGVGSDCIKILIKSLGIAVIAQISVDVCKDNGNSALASCIEISGKIIIIMLSMPLIRSVSQLALELIQK